MSCVVEAAAACVGQHPGKQARRRVGAALLVPRRAARPLVAASASVERSASAAPVLLDERAVLTSLRRGVHPYAQANFRAFYSSILGGIVTDPALMVSFSRRGGEEGWGLLGTSSGKRAAASHPVRAGDGVPRISGGGRAALGNRAVAWIRVPFCSAASSLLASA